MATPKPIIPKASKEAQANAENQNFADIENQFRTNILKDENGIPILLSGRRADGTYGFDVAQPGEDVTTAEDEDLAFSSKFNSFKILSTGTASVEITTGGTYTVVTHSLGYNPAFFIYRGNDVSTEFNMLPYVRASSWSTSDGYLAGLWFDFLTAYSTATTLKLASEKINFNGGAGTSTDTRSFRYYLIREVASA